MRLVVAGLAALIGGQQPAIPPPDSFSWDGPAECLDASTADAALGALLGEGWQTRSEIDVSVDIGVVEGGYRLTVRTVQDGEPAQRVLTDASCGALGEAGILVVALAVRPELELGPGDRELLDRLAGREPDPQPDPASDPKVPEPAPVAEPLEPPEPTPEPEPRTEPTQTRTPPPQDASRLRGAMSLRGTVGWGMLARVHGGVAAGGVLLLPRARFELDGRGWFGPSVPVPDEGRVAIDGWSIGLRGGPTWTLGPVVVPLMLGTEIGQLVGRPEGLRDPIVRRPAWWAFTAAVGAVYSPIERLGLSATLEGFVAVTRPSFSVAGYDALVHRPAQGGVRGLIGVEAYFP